MNIRGIDWGTLLLILAVIFLGYKAVENATSLEIALQRNDLLRDGLDRLVIIEDILQDSEGKVEIRFIMKIENDFFKLDTIYIRR